MTTFIAHTRADGQRQPLIEHLLRTAALSESLAAKAGLAEAGYLVGLLHDLGKYSDEFAAYLNSSDGAANPDSDTGAESQMGDEPPQTDGDFGLAAESGFSGPKGAVTVKGRVDHSSAGAQTIWSKVKSRAPLARLCGQFLAQVIASHHCGLIDSFDPCGACVFLRRMKKDDRLTHQAQACERFLADFKGDINRDLTLALQSVGRWRKALQDLPEGSQAFQLGLGMRFLLSCLVAADWRDSAAFDSGAAIAEMPAPPPDWQLLAGRLEEHLAALSENGKSSPVNRLRGEISQACLNRASSGPGPGLYTLTVPTGGGKTLASLRFALNHAAEHKLDRIFYIMPYTSIIDQNAQAVRAILEPPGEFASVLLEHHSNLEPDTPAWNAKLRAGSWDVPLVFTTMVQFLETLFAGGTSSTRRFHYLARSVLIFDEIQTLPTHSVHLFWQAVNFLLERAGSTALMCTATQPPPNRPDEPIYALPNLGADSEIGPSPEEYFRKLRRTSFVNLTENLMTTGEIAALAAEQAAGGRSCLVVANTIGSAENIFAAVSADENLKVFYLSTRLCPAHRRKIFAELKKELELKKPVICVSTQLMECGVDLSFGAVIRLAAGLDSVLQAAGRCNRHGENLESGQVYLVRAEGEKLPAALEDIKIGQDEFLRVLREVWNSASSPDLNQPGLVKRYFEYYFERQRRVGKMSYPIAAQKLGRSDTALRMLSLNNKTTFKKEEYYELTGFAYDTSNPFYLLRQPFATAGRHYQVIGDGSRGVLAPYGDEGQKLIADLCSTVDPRQQKKILLKAQQYSVNLYHNRLDALDRVGALYRPGKADILIVHSQFYDEKIRGLLATPDSSSDFLDY